MLKRLVLVTVACCMPSVRAAEPADPHRPPAIETSNVPAVPPQVIDRLRQYQNVRTASFAGWSPGGKGMLVQTRFGNAPQLHRVYEPGGRREQITFLDEPVSGGFLPGAKDDAILLSISRGGDENFQLYLQSGDGAGPLLLTDGKSRNSIGPILEDGSKMIVSSNRRNGRDTDLYIADPRKADSMKMLWKTDGQFWIAADWTRDGKTLALIRHVSINEAYLSLLDVASGERTELPLPEKGVAAIGGAAFMPDGRSLYVITDAGSEFRRLSLLDLATKKYDWLTDDLPWDVSDVEVEPKTEQAAFTINEDGMSRLFLLEKDGSRRELKLPLGIVGGLEFSPDGNDLGFTISRPDAPGDAYSIRLSDGELTRWTYSEVGGLNPKIFVRPTRVQFASFDGRNVPAYYYRPRSASAESKVPVLIEIHGGPESQYRPIFSSLFQYFVNEMGVAVIAPNVRGSSGYGKTYLKLDDGMKREDSVKDIGALLDWIAKQPELDASRVAVFGGSYGGYMVLASLIHYPEQIKAGVDVVGIANFITLLEGTAAYRRDLRRVEYGDERDPEMRKFFERISPSTNAEKIRSALLVAHGKNDPRVPFSEAVQIVEKVRSRGRPVWTLYAANEGHGFVKKDNLDYLRAVVVMFVRDSLGVK